MWKEGAIGKRRGQGERKGPGGRKVPERKANEVYNQGKETVQHLAVTNDPGERAIKLITDYSQILTKDESDRQALLQAVERHRRLNLHPN